MVDCPPLVNINDFIVDSFPTIGKQLSVTISAENQLTEMEITVKSKVPTSNIILPKKSNPIPEKFPYKCQFQIHYLKSDSTLPKIMILRDSYAGSLLHLMPESFHKTVFVWDN